MAITYPLAYPSRNPVSFTLRPNNVVGRNMAPTTGVTQRYEWPSGKWWEASLELGTHDRIDGETLAAWLTSLNDAVGTFLMGDPASATPRGSARTTPGVPVVSGAHSALSKTLAISTGLGTVTGYLKAGDYIQLGTTTATRLHKVLQDLNLSGGVGTADIWPPLRTSYSNGTTVVVSSAKGRFLLTSKPDWTTAGSPPDYKYRFAPVSCMEDLS